MNRSRTRLYLITPPQIDLDHFPALLDETLAAGDVACLQLRLKQPDATPPEDAVISAAVDRLQGVAQAHNVAFLVNDRPDLAQAHQCDGAHIGQQDMDYKQARALLGDDKIIGVTCHNARHLAMLAGEAGADYVAFGAFFDTPTKQANTRANPDILAWWQGVMRTPCVAIGGISPDTAAALVIAGADFIAASSHVWQHEQGPANAVAAFNALFDQLQAKSANQNPELGP